MLVANLVLRKIPPLFVIALSQVGLFKCFSGSYNITTELPWDDGCWLLNESSWICLNV